MEVSKSLLLAKKYLGKRVRVVIDRPLNSRHPKHGFTYESNYGYIPGVIAPDGEELDAYFLGISEPIENAIGECIGVIHRLDDDDDKLIVVPPGLKMSNVEIEKAIRFQEKWFKHKILRNR